MTADMLKEGLLERRHETMAETNEHWESLTLAQKFAASSLRQFGYHLNFIRDFHHTHTAFLSCENNMAVICKGGEISIQPKIKIRN